MRVALVTPPYDLMRQGYGSKRFIRAGFFPPLGIGYLAAPLLKKGHRVKIIDAPPLFYQNEDILRALKEFQPAVIGISSLTASAQESYSLIKFLKINLPQIPLILGGAHATCFPEQIFQAAPELDCLVYGEGENVFQEIIESIETKGYIRDNILGAWVKKENGFIQKNSPALPVMDLDRVPRPAFDLYDYKIYRPLPLQYKKLPVANIITSRGCPYGQCAFCFESGRAAQKYRRHSPSRVIEEIKLLMKNHGIQEITFWDDNFLVNEKWITEFCDLLEREKIKIPWSACARVNTITQKMLQRAKKTGLWCIFYGFETGNQELLDRIKKGATLEQAKQAAKLTHQLGIDTRGSFMLALPGETPAQAMRTIEFAKELDVTFAQFLLTHPEWGTALYEDAVKSGRVVPLYKGRTTPTYVPDDYQGPAEVMAMQKRAYKSFYFRLSFIWKHFKRLKSWDAFKQYYQGLKYILGVSS